MPFKSEAQRRWMHANKPEMADKWEEHTPKKKLPKKVQKSESIERKLNDTLSESGLASATMMMEGRGHKPALILMKRGTLIPVHHYRMVPSPTTGEIWVIAGIDPARYEVLVTGGFPSQANAPFTHKMRDFYSAGQWIPSRRAVAGGWQDETGWAIDEDGEGHYDARRDYTYIRKFRKILTMKESNIQTLKPLPPDADPKAYEREQYDDDASWYRRQRTRGTQLD